MRKKILAIGVIMALFLIISTEHNYMITGSAESVDTICLFGIPIMDIYSKDVEFSRGVVKDVALVIYVPSEYGCKGNWK